jgi:hypothetical protein
MGMMMWKRLFLFYICDNLRHLRTIALAIFLEPFIVGRPLSKA